MSNKNWKYFFSNPVLKTPDFWIPANFGIIFLVSDVLASLFNLRLLLNVIISAKRSFEENLKEKVLSNRWFRKLGKHYLSVLSPEKANGEFICNFFLVWQMRMDVVSRVLCLGTPQTWLAFAKIIFTYKVSMESAERNQYTYPPWVFHRFWVGKQVMGHWITGLTK